MMRSIAVLHMAALPSTWSSRRGGRFVAFLYQVVACFGFVHSVKRHGRIVGVVSGIGPIILTLVVDPVWQRKGVGSELLAGLTGKRVVYTQEDSVGFYEKKGFVRIFRVGNLIFLCRK